MPGIAHWALVKQGSRRVGVPVATSVEQEGRVTPLRMARRASYNSQFGDVHR